MINMNKNQVIMDMKKYMKALPAVAALLLTAACSNDDFETIDTPQPAKERIIHFAANVDNSTGTRATLNGSGYTLQEGDKLYVWGTNISGELTMTKYYGTSADFAGDLTYTGDKPGVIDLHAVVKGVNDQILGTLDEFKARGYVPSYTNGIASDKTDAVEKCSFLTSTHYNCDLSVANPSCIFGPSQESAFISFDITLEDGTAANEDITVTVNNGGSAVCSGNVKTVDEGGAIKAQFTAALPGGTKLSGATVKLGSRAQIDFGGSRTLDANKNYTVNKTYRYKLAISGEYSGQSFSSERGYATLPVTMTLSKVLSIKPELAPIASMIQNCESSNSDIVEVTGSKPNFTFNAKAEGNCTVTLSLLLGSVDLNFVVQDLQP